MHLTVEDWARVGRFHLHGAAGSTLTHTGNDTLWYSMVWVPLEHGFGVLVATNKGGNQAREAVDHALWHLVLDHYQL